MRMIECGSWQAAFNDDYDRYSLTGSFTCETHEFATGDLVGLVLRRDPDSITLLAYIEDVVCGYRWLSHGVVSPPVKPSIESGKMCVVFVPD